MALSFLSLPPEVRVQIYRHLLCHNTWIQPKKASHHDEICWPLDVLARTQGMNLVPSFEAGPRTEYSPEIAILKTCRIIYAEAMPILYGENSFSYEPCTHVLNQAQHSKARFPAKNLDFMKHLELEVREERWNAQSIVWDVADIILYFARGRCDLHTLKLSLIESLHLSEGEQYTNHHLIDNLCSSSELAELLVALQVSESLTLSIWCHPFDSHYVGEIGKRARDEYQGYVNRLASEKGMTAIMEVDLPEEEDEDDYDTDEDYDYNICKMSWCLRPQRPQPQSSTMPSLID